MSLVMTSGPAIEAITVAEAKAHLRIDGTAEDMLLGSLILTSRLHVEAALGLALITQSWMLLLDHWPADGVVDIPLRPVQSVTAVRVLPASGPAVTLAAPEYLFDGASAPPRLVRVGTWPHPGKAARGVEIDFVAGYGAAAASVPEPIRQALLLLVAHWYEHRDPIEIGSSETALPAAMSELLLPYRLKRL